MIEMIKKKKFWITMIIICLVIIGGYTKFFKEDDNLFVTAEEVVKRDVIHKVNASGIIQPEEEMGTRLAHSFFNVSVEEYLELTSNFGVSRFRVPDRFSGTTLEELGFTSSQDSYGLTPVAMCRSRKVTINPLLDQKLKSGDLIIVIAHDRELESLDSISSDKASQLIDEL